MDDTYSREISMSSLLATFLLEADCIKYTDIAKCISYLENKGIYVSENDNDIDKISHFIVFDNDEFYLTKRYNDIINVDNKNMTVNDYLSSLTSNEVINYCEEFKKERAKVIA